MATVIENLNFAKASLFEANICPNVNHKSIVGSSLTITVELVQSDTQVFRHPVTFDKTLWSQSISVN
jgi:hypothetical protein